MNARFSFGSFFKLKPGEHTIAVPLWALSFCIGFGCITLYATSRALFLSYFAAADLAWVFIGIAVALATARSVFTFLERRLARRPLFVIIFALLGLSLAGFRVWFAMGWRPEWAAFSAAVWLYVCFYLSNLAFWGLSGLLLDLRQAKRLFGLIGSGELVATCCIGLAAQPLAQTLGAVNLLTLSAVGFAVAAVLAASLARNSSVAAEAENRHDPAASLFKNLRRDPYLLTLHLLWGMATAGLFLADLIYNTQVRANFTDPETLAGFFGLFFAVASLLTLTLRSLFAAEVIDALGPANALFPLPVALCAVVLGLVATTHLFPGVPAAVFWFAVGCKLADYVLRYGLFKPAFMVLYQPLRRQQRIAVQSSVEGVADPVATLAAGVLLLLGQSVIGLHAETTAGLLLVLLLGWFIATAAMRRQYPEKLLDAVRKKIFSSTDVDLDDRRSLSLVAKRLESARPVEVIYCTDILEKKMPETMETVLLQNLFHSEAMVRLDALARIERLRLSYPLDVVQDLAANDEDPDVAAAALTALAALQEDEATDTLITRLNDPEPRIEAAAMVGLIRYAGIEGVIAAGSRLIAMHEAPDAKVRRRAAEILAAVGSPSFYRPLLGLLADPDIPVRAAAIEAAGRVRNPRLAAGLVANLAQRELRGRVVRALAAIGEPCLPVLAAALDSPGQTPHRAAAIVSAVARIQGAVAAHFLAARVMYPDFALRRQILEALQARNYQASSDERELFDYLLDEEFRFAAWHTHGRAAVTGDPAYAQLSRALENEIVASVARLLALLSFLFPNSRLNEARRALSHRQRERRAYGLELLDQGLPAARKKHLLPLLEDLTFSARLRRLEDLLPTPRPSVEDVLVNIVERTYGSIGVWTKAVALYGMGLKPAPAFRAPLAALLDATEDPMLRETALWAWEKGETEVGEADQ